MPNYAAMISGGVSPGCVDARQGESLWSFKRRLDEEMCSKDDVDAADVDGLVFELGNVKFEKERGVCITLNCGPYTVTVTG